MAQVSRKPLLRDINRQAKGMTSRIKEHAPPIRCRLLVNSARPETDSFAFSLVQVVHCKVEVYLFRETASGP